MGVCVIQLQPIHTPAGEGKLLYKKDCRGKRTCSQTKIAVATVVVRWPGAHLLREIGMVCSTSSAVRGLCSVPLGWVFFLYVSSHIVPKYGLR